MNPRGLFLAALISVIEAHIQYSESLRTLLDRPAAERTSVSQVLVPFMDNCDSMVGMFPDDTFPDFSLQAVLDFSKPCREVQLLYEYTEKLTHVMERIECGMYPVRDRGGIKSMLIPPEDKPGKMPIDRCEELQVGYLVSSCPFCAVVY